LFNPVTKEVFDQHRNKMGHGELDGKGNLTLILHVPKNPLLSDTRI